MPTAAPLTRAAVSADLPAIAAIHAHAVHHTPAVFREDPLTDAAWAQWLAHDHPTRVVEAQGQVRGFVAARPYSPGLSGYDGMAWVSIYVHPDAHGQGLGRALMADLIAVSPRHGLRELVSRIAVPNPASVRLHEAFGFEHMGRWARAGVKFGKVWDVVLMQRAVG